jgi:peptidyl-prolyl cis-trans isomerase SurA
MPMKPSSRAPSAPTAAFALALVCATLGGTAHTQTRSLSDRGEMLDRVAAVVNDGVVLNSELEEQIAEISGRMKAQNMEMPPAQVLRQQVLERLIVQEVDYPSYRESVRREMTMQVLRQRDVLQRINVSPREIEQFLAKQRNRPSESSEYNISHILIAVPQDPTPRQLEEAARRAEDVSRRARSGEDFAQLAIANSNSQTALEGGALGWRRGPEIPTVLADIVVRLKAGETSEPLRTPTGYHIVRLNEMRGEAGQGVVEQTHARHILLKPTEVQDDATVEQRLRDVRARILKGEDFAGLAKTLSEDPGSAVDGGDLGWTVPGTFVPEFDKALAALKENEISQPFRTQFGWHIVQLLGKRQFDNTEELQRQRAFMQLRESKADEEVELWLRRLRDEAYVDVKT